MQQIIQSLTPFTQEQLHIRRDRALYNTYYALSHQQAKAKDEKEWLAVKAAWKAEIEWWDAAEEALFLADTWTPQAPIGWKREQARERVSLGSETSVANDMGHREVTASEHYRAQQEARERADEWEPYVIEINGRYEIGNTRQPNSTSGDRRSSN